MSSNDDADYKSVRRANDDTEYDADCLSIDGPVRSTDDCTVCGAKR